jgi:hypothetical protein
MHIRLILLILFHFIFLSYTLKNLPLNSYSLKRNSIFYNSIQSQSISGNDRNKLLDIILSIADNIDTDPEKSMLVIILINIELFLLNSLFLQYLGSLYLRN